MYWTTTDASDLYHYINKEAKVKLKSSQQELTGFIYTIDPVSLSLVLVNTDPKDSHINEIFIINPDDLSSLELIEPQNSKEEFFETLFESPDDQRKESKSSAPGADDDTLRKEKMIEMLNKNRLPNKIDTETGIINIMDTIQIHPPYRSSDCESTNEIILAKILNLMKQIEQ